MNMNREAVNIALGYAGNMPLSEEDKKYKNLVYVFCKNLYLPTLFNSLCEIDWRCARKEAPLQESSRRHMNNGKYYYEMPADCIKPLYVDGNDTDFRNDTRFIITTEKAATLYYVFHNRSADCQAVTAPDNQLERDNNMYISRPDNEYEARDGRQVLTRPRAAPNYPGLPGYDPAKPEVDKYGVLKNDDDFPEWDFTPYDADFWAYFQYKFAAALVPKLRADDGAAGRAQALEGIAAQLGERVITRSREAQANPARRHKSWAEQCGLSSNPGAFAPEGYSPYFKAR